MSSSFRLVGPFEDIENMVPGYEITLYNSKGARINASISHGKWTETALKGEKLSKVFRVGQRGVEKNTKFKIFLGDEPNGKDIENDLTGDSSTYDLLVCASGGKSGFDRFTSKLRKALKKESQKGGDPNYEAINKLEEECAIHVCMQIIE